VKRRTFIAGLGIAAVWPLAARAQQDIQRRRIGILMGFASDDPEGLARVGAFLQGLQEWGWALGRNVQIDYRWASDGERIRTYAAELVALGPDIFLYTGATAVRALQQETRTLPIVFVGVTDPVGAGHVESLARPGRNATGFTVFEYGMSANGWSFSSRSRPR
jgi:putative ABC transport system substrate-binding protein